MDLVSSFCPTDEFTHNKPRILAVDDNDDSLILLTYILQALDCAFLTTKRGDKVFRLAQYYQPDLILLDVMLPGMNGCEIIRELKQDQQTATIPIIVVTALALPKERERILKIGCDDYITKPYLIKDLETSICRYLPKKPLFSFIDAHCQDSDQIVVQK